MALAPNNLVDIQVLGSLRVQGMAFWEPNTGFSDLMCNFGGFEGGVWSW